MKDGSDPKYPPAGPDRLAPGPQSDESWLKALVEQSPLGISIARDGITLYANQACARLFGYDSPEEIVGTSQLGRVAPEMPRAGDRLHPAPQARRAGAVGLRDQGTSQGRIDISPVRGGHRIDWEDGPVSMAYFTDFTARKEMEGALRKAHDELESRVASARRNWRNVNEKLLDDIKERQRDREALRQREQELKDSGPHARGDECHSPDHSGA